jgi:hypothetical protein
MTAGVAAGHAIALGLGPRRVHQADARPDRSGQLARLGDALADRYEDETAATAWSEKRAAAPTLRLATRGRRPKIRRVAVCAVFRDEARYLRRWFEFHRFLASSISSCITIAAATLAATSSTPWVLEGIVRPEGCAVPIGESRRNA